MEKNVSVPKCKKLQKAGKSAVWVVAVLAAAAALWLVFCSFTGRLPTLFGYGIVRIKSGSMEPIIHTGDFILIRKTAPEEIKIGDIITFRSDDPVIKDKPNTHEVVDIQDGGREFVTKGRANLSKDAYTARAERLYGRYVSTLGTLTAFYAFLTLPYVFWPGIGLVLGLYALFYIRDRKENARAAKESEKATLFQNEMERLQAKTEKNRDTENDKNTNNDHIREKKGGFDEDVSEAKDQKKD